jgi:hypothetical protein
MPTVHTYRATTQQDRVHRTGSNHADGTVLETAGIQSNHFVRMLHTALQRSELECEHSHTKKKKNSRENQKKKAEGGPGPQRTQRPGQGRSFEMRSASYAMPSLSLASRCRESRPHTALGNQVYSSPSTFGLSRRENVTGQTLGGKAEAGVDARRAPPGR